jgi:predicted metalloendopeptidase
MRNWWTPQDLTSFKAKTKSLVDHQLSKAFPDLTENLRLAKILEI